MKFRPPSIEIAPPIALQVLDDRLGTQTQNAYATAVEMAPRLNGLAVILDDERPHFRGSHLGLGGSHVAISSDPEFYREAIRSGIVERRMGRLSTFFHSRGEIPAMGHLIVSVFLHEMGHANDFAGYIERASGNARVALELSDRKRKSELEMLPLKVPTSYAQKAWDDNTEGYRDKLTAQGMTPEIWAKYIDKNSSAYSKLPCEFVADTFALKVLEKTRV